jgi:hypothetical protein
MIRSLCVGLVLLSCGAPFSVGQTDVTPLETYFTGRMVLVKVDMPGSEKGIDLKFNKPEPMDWNDTSSRDRTFGVAIHKGEVARITKFKLKDDMIEFQLNGGGFGVSGDDTNTVVNPIVVPKSDHEKDLEKQLAAEKDPHRRQDIQRDLDHERQRRDDQNARNQSDARVASQIKAQQVAQRRLTGGSRFNLRWQGTVPSDSRSPDGVMQALAAYVDFNPAPGAGAPQPAYAQPAYAPPPAAYGPAPGPPSSGNPSQVKRGMKIDEVSNLLGRGRTVNDGTSADGLHTQEIMYASGDNLVDVTFVEGVVVRYSITSK